MSSSKLLLSVFALGILACGSLRAQNSVDPMHRYERLVCIVPMIGTGKTADDPRRPMFVAADGQLPAKFLSFNFLPSDDGDWALVEFVATDRSAFAGILATKDGRVKAFLKGQAQRQDVETAFKQHRRNLNLDHFGAWAQ
jgi:hypothetical protein